MISLSSLGWSSPTAPRLPAPARRGASVSLARVVAQHRSEYELLGDEGPLRARIPGRLRFAATAAQQLPAVGDWVAVERSPAETAIIQSILRRRTALVRKAAGVDAVAQVLAANVDVVFVVAGLDTDPNSRRLERYLSAAWESGASPVVVLTKADLSPHLEADVGELSRSAPGVEVCPVCAPRGEGLDALRAHLGPGRTAVLVGPSGAGKSTLTNALLGHDAQDTGANRASDGRGRHTTTGRHLLLLPDDGGCLIDTPGLRELALWDEGQGGVAHAFPDVEELGRGCRFRDCEHQAEPGCAILSAAEAGELDPGRLASYRKLLREQAFVRRKADRDARKAEQRKWKQVTKNMRQRRKLEGW